MNYNIIIFLLVLLDDTLCRNYIYNSYDEIHERFNEYSLKYPSLIKIDTSQSRYKLDSLTKCGDTACINQIALITNFEEYSIDKPQVSFL